MPTSRSYIEQISHNNEMMMKKVFSCLFCFVCLFNFSSRFWVRFPPSDNIISLSYSMSAFSVNLFGLFCLLFYRSPFVSPFGKREEARKKKREFALWSSDQITDLQAYNAWIIGKIVKYVELVPK